MSTPIPMLDLMFFLTESVENPRHVGSALTFKPPRGGAHAAREIVDASDILRPAGVLRRGRSTHGRPVGHVRARPRERGQLVEVRQLVLVTRAVQHDELGGGAPMKRVTEHAPQRGNAGDGRDHQMDRCGLEQELAFRSIAQRHRVPGPQGEQ